MQESKLSDGNPVISRAALVYGQMNEPPGARARVGLSALTVAEYFRDEEGKDVILFIDNIFRFVQANSEVSALLGRMPSAVGYQPTLGTDIGELQERITTTKKGSITSVQAIYVPADDLTDPAPATTFAHLDATTVLSRQIAGGDVDRLHRGDGALLGGGDPLLELADVGAEGRLVADGRGHAAEERRDLGVRLHEAEDVVDEEDDVLPLLVAEVLGDGERREPDAGARAGRLVHLAVDQGGARDDRVAVGKLRLLHLDVEVVALARTLADAAEHRHAAVLLGDVVDELQDDHGLAHAGTAEEPDLPAPLVGGEEVDDLDPGLEGLHLRLLVGEGRRLAMDGVALRGRDRAALVDRLADHVHDAAEGRLADRHLDAVARVAHLLAAGEPVGRVHGGRAHGLLAPVRRHLDDQAAGPVVDRRGGDLECVVGRGQVPVGERHVDGGADHLRDASDVGHVRR